MIGMTQIIQEFEETVERTCSLLVFQLAGQAFALNIEAVAQIIPMLRLTPVPQVNDMIEGVANIHGKIVPVVSARRHLGLPYLEPGLYTPIVLTRLGERQVGWIVDEVTDVISVPAASITSPGDILPDGLENTQVMSGLVYQQDRSILVLDPRYVLRPSQFRTINRAVHTNSRLAETRPALDADDSDDFQLAGAPRPADTFETVRTMLAEKGNGAAGHGNGASGNGNGASGNGAASGNGNGKTVSAQRVEPAAPKPMTQEPAAFKPTASQAAAQQPEDTTPVEPAAAAAAPAIPAAPEPPAPMVVEKPVTGAEVAAPAAAQPAENPPTQSANQTPAAPAEKKSKSTRRGNGKGKIIPATASSAAAAQPQSSRQQMKSTLARQFAALANELMETEAKPDGDAETGADSTEA